MKLPNGDRAVVDIVKLRDYSLSLEHPRGHHKARVFAAALGLTARDAEELRQLLLANAAAMEALPAWSDQYVDRYVLHQSHGGISMLVGAASAGFILALV